MKLIITKDFFIGIGLFLLILMCMFGLNASNISNSYILLLLVSLILLLLIVLRILHKPYIAAGFITGVVAILLFFAIFIIELAIHPSTYSFIF